MRTELCVFVMYAFNHNLFDQNLGSAKFDFLDEFEIIVNTYIPTDIRKSSRNNSKFCMAPNGHPFVVHASYCYYNYSELDWQI